MLSQKRVKSSWKLILSICGYVKSSLEHIKSSWKHGKFSCTRSSKTVNITSLALNMSSNNKTCQMKLITWQVNISSQAWNIYSWDRHMSTARSHASHIECWWVGGNSGCETGVQSQLRIILSAKRKFLKSLIDWTQVCYLLLAAFALNWILYSENIKLLISNGNTIWYYSENINLCNG